MTEERLEQLEAEVAALKALIEGAGVVILDEGVIAGHGRYRRIDFLNASITDRGDRIEVNVTGGSSGNHALDSATHTDVNSQTNQKGDLLVQPDAAGNWDRLARGSSGQYLRADGSGTAWSALQAADLPTSTVRHADTTERTPADHHDPVTVGAALGISDQQVFHDIEVGIGDLHPGYQLKSAAHTGGGYGKMYGEIIIASGVFPDGFIAEE